MSEIAKLRELAERRLPKTPALVEEPSGPDTARLLYELRVHQEELEIQNEHLRQTQLELHESRDRYVDLYEFAPVGYLTLDAEGHIVEANLTVATLLKADRARLIGGLFLLYCAEKSRANLRASFDELLSSQSRCICELPFVKRDGSELFARLDCTIVHTQTNAPQIRVVVTDITEQAKATIALREKDRHLRALADALPVLIARLDCDFRICFVNTAYLNWFGQSLEVLFGKQIQAVMGEQFNIEMSDYFFDAIAGRQVQFESHLKHRTRGLRDVQVMLVPDRGPGGAVKGVHTLIIDITERKIVEASRARRRDFSERLVHLTSDEIAVYELLVQGESNKSIALRLDIGLRTVERRRQSILKKLQVGSISQLLQQLVDIPRIDSLA